MFARTIPRRLSGFARQPNTTPGRGLAEGCPPKTHVFQGFYDLFRLLPPNLPPNYHAIDRIVGSLWTKYQPCPDTVMVRFLPKRPVVRGKPPLDSVPRTRYQGYCIPDHGSRTMAQRSGWRLSSMASKFLMPTRTAPSDARSTHQ